jgi:cation/acetate symporter
MSAPVRLRTPNPHLGVYYGIVTSAFASLVIALALFEQLGWSEARLALAIILLPIALYLIIAVGARTLNIVDFFVSGRRVPPVFNGFVLAAVTIGGTGFFAYVGTLYFFGFDALAIGLGWASGLMVSMVLFAPYLRKAGAFTLPSFLGRRFGSRWLRVAASVLQIPPTALLLAAELKIAALIAAMFLSLSYGVVVVVVAGIVACIAGLGGMRSLTWSGSAQFIVAAVGFSVPLIIVSVLLTHLPAPQITYGELLSSLQTAEISAGISLAQPEQLAIGLPNAMPRASVKPFLQTFGAIGRIDFLALFFCFALGTAALPSLLARSGVTSSVSEQRWSCAWGTLLVALFVISAPALAVFVKYLLFQDIAQISNGSIPHWLAQLNASALAYARDFNGDGMVNASELLIARDSLVLALPMAAQLPSIFTLLLAVAGLAIALAAAGAHLFTLASSLAEDVYRVADPHSTALPRLTIVWVALAAVALATAVFLAMADVDLLQAALTAFAFAAATFFPVLLLAIWWRDCSLPGAIAAMGTGFAVTGLEVFFGGTFGAGHADFTTAIAALIGAGLAIAAGLATSLLFPKTKAVAGAYFEELRDPAGEAISDRPRRETEPASQ